MFSPAVRASWVPCSRTDPKFRQFALQLGDLLILPLQALTGALTVRLLPGDFPLQAHDLGLVALHVLLVGWQRRCR